MYTRLQLGTGGTSGGDACIRLLHSGGSVGCFCQGASCPLGPLVPVSGDTPSASLPQDAVAMVTAADAGLFLKRCIQDSELTSRLAGVLIENSTAFPGWNAANPSPLGEYASYSNATYVWNPYGLGLIDISFPFPIFQLDNVTSHNARQRAEYNIQARVRNYVLLDFLPK